MDSFLVFIGIVLFVIWILYKLTARFLYSSTLTWVHVILTLLVAFIVIATIYANAEVNSIAESNGSNYGIVGFTISGPLLLPLLIQLIYFVNLFGAKLKYNR